MDVLTEWTFEGDLNRDERTEVQVGVTGIRTRYQVGVYDSTWKSGLFVNLSGTAIIRFYYRLKQ